MEQKTMGTTMQNIRLEKMLPKGFSMVAASGQSAPTTQPLLIPASMHKANP
ncbi:MAG: hypothetical protein Q4B50_07730 [Bacillota bacterium]|nr:hypothetical protein [Bacillota bacterium]